MPDEGVTIRGWPELAAGTTKLAANIGETSRQNLAGVADRVAAQVSSSVPHLSGALAADVTVQATDEGVGVGYAGGVPYAGWIDFGGGHGRPYVGSGRYLYPAAEAARPDIEAAALAAADTETKGMQWPTPT
jgi:hypothetical protein